MTRLGVLLLVACSVQGQTLVFHVPAPGEVTAELEMSSPNSDWAIKGREASVALLRTAGRPDHHVMLYAGAKRHPYRVFLGHFEPGRYELSVERDAAHSAKDSGLEVTGARFDFSGGAVVANAPVLYARADTIGTFSDVPLVVYCEREPDGTLVYTVVFSNEDGGTSTRALMARWGRSTDIEYVYRLESDRRATVQGRGHKNVLYSGGFDGAHPLLTPVTNNNMVEGNAPTPLRFQLAPKLVSLEGHSREAAMDDEPVTYEVMRKELIREGRLRPFGIVDGDKISDPFNYLVVECKLALRDGKVAVLARRNGETRWYGSHLGRPDYAIDRSGWVRAAVELPVGTQGIAEIGFECLEGSHYRGTPEPCVVEQVGRVFFPGQNAIRVRGTPVSLAAGQIAGLVVE